MTTDALVQLQALQHPEGGFASVVTSRMGRLLDYNGFVTAMVLRRLRHLPESSTWADIRRRALDWLWSCRSEDVPGAFAFWPDRARPSWARTVPPDVDDTSIILAELLRHGRLDRVEALRGLCKAIVPHRVDETAAAVLPFWVIPGTFYTWIAACTSGSPPRVRPTNVVDCCVNVNVVALMALLEARHLPGYRSAVQMVLNGLDWAGDDEMRLASLTPFYPSVTSLVDAIEHALECGAEELREGLARVTSLPPDLLKASPGACRSAYGKTVWQAPAIDLACDIACSQMS
jgi:hypothetical protein